MISTSEKDPLESVGEEFAQGLKKVLDEIRKTWTKIGYNNEQCKERIENLKKKSFSSLQEILDAETQEKNKRWEAIITKLQDISATSSAVNEPCPRIVLLFHYSIFVFLYFYIYRILQDLITFRPRRHLTKYWKI